MMNLQGGKVKVLIYDTHFLIMNKGCSKYQTIILGIECFSCMTGLLQHMATFITRGQKRGKKDSTKGLCTKKQ